MCWSGVCSSPLSISTAVATRIPDYTINELLSLFRCGRWPVIPWVVSAPQAAHHGGVVGRRTILKWVVQRVVWREKIRVDVLWREVSRVGRVMGVRRRRQEASPQHRIGEVSHFEGIERICRVFHGKEGRDWHGGYPTRRHGIGLAHGWIPHQVREPDGVLRVRERLIHIPWINHSWINHSWIHHSWIHHSWIQQRVVVDALIQQVVLVGGVV